MFDGCCDRGHISVVVWLMANVLGACIHRSFNKDGASINSFTNKRGMLK